MYLIFDMDGVIIDSAKLKIDALKMTFNKLNIVIAESEMPDNKILAYHPHDLLKAFYHDFNGAVLCHEYIHSTLRKGLNFFLSFCLSRNCCHFFTAAVAP